MPAYVCITIFGTFLFDSESNIITQKLVYPDAELAVQQSIEISQEQTPIGLRNLSAEFTDYEIDELVVESRPLKLALSDLVKIPVTVESASEVIRWFRSQHDEHLLTTGVVDSPELLMDFRHGVAIEVAKKVLSEASDEKVLLVKHAIDAIGEVDKAINVMAMRLREWWSLYHPSLNMLVDDHEVYAKIVHDSGMKSDMSEDELAALGVPEGFGERIIETLGSDEGAELDTDHLEIIQNLAGGVLSQIDLRKRLESYVTELMKKVGPNTSALVGPLIAARLLSLTGTMKELARKPSSTIQILGAEKALFRSLKTGADPPKHGIIFQVPIVNTAPYWQRGKIARALAGKLAIAAKIDAYSRRDASDTLLSDLKTRVEQIQEQNPDAPPPKPKKKPPRERKGRGRKGRPRKRGGRQR
jgi:nucleolar protein 56